MRPVEEREQLMQAYLGAWNEHDADREVGEEQRRRRRHP